MLNFKSLKLCLGVTLSLGLSACGDDVQRSEQTDVQYEQISTKNQRTTQNKQATKKPQAQQKTYASKDPTEQATPGPARKTPPQLPVISN